MHTHTQLNMHKLRYACVCTRTGPLLVQVELCTCACVPACHSCAPVVNRPWSGSGPWPRGWGPLGYSTAHSKIMSENVQENSLLSFTSIKGDGVGKNSTFRLASFCRSSITIK